MTMYLYVTIIIHSVNIHRAGGTDPVGQAKTGTLSSTDSVMIVAFINTLCMSVVVIATTS